MKGGEKDEVPGLIQMKETKMQKAIPGCGKQAEVRGC